MMWAFLGSVLIPLLKFIGNKSKKKELSDKEFVAFILEHQNRNKNPGQTALDFEAALDKAFKEIEDQEIDEAEKELEEHQKPSQ